MSDKPKTTAMDLLGIMPNPYPDIPSEYQLGLARGALGDWLQEVYDAGWDVAIESGTREQLISEAWGSIEYPKRATISHWKQNLGYHGTDDDTHRVDIMIARAYIAWKGREGA